jgi:hypothetical protein
LLADGLSAIHHRQSQFFPLILQRYQKVLSILDKRSEGGFKDACLISQAEFLAAQKYYIENNPKASFEILSNGLKIQNKIQMSHQSLTLPYIPLQEFYADLLLQTGSTPHLKKALDLFSNDLKYYPNRFQALKGMAITEEKLGNKKIAKYWDQKLMDQFNEGDPSEKVTFAKELL